MKYNTLRLIQTKAYKRSNVKGKVKTQYKSQVTLPPRMLKSLGWKKGAKLDAVLVTDGIFLRQSGTNNSQYNETKSIVSGEALFKLIGSDSLRNWRDLFNVLCAKGVVPEIVLFCRSGLTGTLGLDPYSDKARMTLTNSRSKIRQKDLAALYLELSKTNFTGLDSKMI